MYCTQPNPNAYTVLGMDGTNRRMCCAFLKIRFLKVSYLFSLRFLQMLNEKLNFDVIYAFLLFQAKFPEALITRENVSKMLSFKESVGCGQKAKINHKKIPFLISENFNEANIPKQLCLCLKRCIKKIPPRCVRKGKEMSF